MISLTLFYLMDAVFQFFLSQDLKVYTPEEV